MHVLEIMAHDATVPYFNWFAEASVKESGIKMSFAAFSQKKPQMLKDMQERDCACYWVYFNPSRKKLSYLVSVFRFYVLFRKIKPDIVHTHLFDDSLPALFAARLAHIKVRIITKQDTTFHYYYKPQYVAFDRFNNRNATHIHAVANRNRDFILDIENADSKKVHLIRNGFPLSLMTASNSEYLQELKERYSLHNKIVIGTVARLIEWKGHQYIIKAASELVKKYPNLAFVWAGTGEQNYIKQLKNLIKQNDLEEHIIFCDWIDRKMMPSFYQTLDIYLHPAVEEPFGFAITEALMNQVPVVATRTGSTDLMEHQKSGYVLEEKSVESILEGVEYYLQDKENRTLIALEGYNLAKENLTFDVMWKGHLELYKKALRSKNLLSIDLSPSE